MTNFLKFHSKPYISILFTCFLCYSLEAQTEWNLKKDKEGIAVYTAKLEDSKFKSIRVVCEFHASLSQLVAVLMQPSLQPEWVLATKEANLVKQISSARIYYYAEAALPWPMNNRDMVIDLSMSQHPITKLLTIRANTIDNILPIKEGKQRVPLSQAIWLVQPLPDNKISIDYQIKIDPGGGIPPWMVNLFIGKAPFESFKNLSKLLSDKRFKGQHFDFLKD
ncbi:MAG: lipid-binding protein [Chitinophagaceae bacterium BSSC1]|nr:MAG: lipid-binding protein [Chitinophagaceae bacterium BSSC1]